MLCCNRGNPFLVTKFDEPRVVLVVHEHEHICKEKKAWGNLAPHKEHCNASHARYASHALTEDRSLYKRVL